MNSWKEKTKIQKSWFCMFALMLFYLCTQPVTLFHFSSVKILGMYVFIMTELLFLAECIFCQKKEKVYRFRKLLKFSLGAALYILACIWQYPGFHLTAVKESLATGGCFGICWLLARL